MSARPAPGILLTEIRITEKRPNFRGKRLEVWAAVSLDGLWSFTRTDEPGTPWSVERTGYDGFVLTGSLLSGQQITANGYALARLEEQQAEIEAARRGSGPR